MFFERVTLTCDQLWRKTCNWYIIKSLLIFFSLFIVFHPFLAFPSTPHSLLFYFPLFLSPSLHPTLSLILTCFFSCLPHLLLLSFLLSLLHYLFLSVSPSLAFPTFICLTSCCFPSISFKLPFAYHSCLLLSLLLSIYVSHTLLLSLPLFLSCFNPFCLSNPFFLTFPPFFSQLH